MPPTSARRVSAAPLFFVALGLFADLAGAQATTNPDAPAPSVTPSVRSEAHPGWWNDAVFYEVFVRSFNDSRSGPLANDGIGDLQGLIDTLDYLNDGDPKTDSDLGVTALWLMPISPSPSYHGYDVTNYSDVEPKYGTREDFTRLIEQAHKRGIRIVIDLVLNHCSNRNPWFIEAKDPASPKHDWFIWADKPTDYKGPWNERIWHRLDVAGTRPVYYYGLFSGEMPDLNYRNPEVTAAARETVRTWLTDLHVDGFRLDAIRHLIENGPIQENTPETHDWLRGFFSHYKKINPDAFTIGEVWATPEVEASYVGDQLDTTFDFELAKSLVTAVQSGQADSLAKALEANARAFPLNQFGSFLTNHDQARIMTELLKTTKGDRAAAVAKAGLAAKLLMVLPGIPFVYYGEEIGMVGDKPDPRIRTPMQWSAGEHAGFSTARPWMAPNSDINTVNVDAQSHDATSLFSTYRHMIRVRQSSPSLLRGDLQLLPTSNPAVIAFRRAAPGAEPMLLVANLSEKPISDFGISTPGFSVEAQSDLIASVPVVARAQTDAAYKPVSLLNAYQVLIIRTGPTK